MNSLIARSFQCGDVVELRSIDPRHSDALKECYKSKSKAVIVSWRGEDAARICFPGGMAPDFEPTVKLARLSVIHSYGQDWVASLARADKRSIQIPV